MPKPLWLRETENFTVNWIPEAGQAHSGWIHAFDSKTKHEVRIWAKTYTSQRAIVAAVDELRELNEKMKHQRMDEFLRKLAALMKEYDATISYNPGDHDQRFITAMREAIVFSVNTEACRFEETTLNHHDVYYNC